MDRSGGPIGKLAQGVTSGIGFVSEVRGYKKAKKAAQKERELDLQQSQSEEPQGSSSSGSRSLSSETANLSLNEKNAGDLIAEPPAYDEIERSWELNEAQDEVIEAQKPRKSKEGTANPDKVLSAFLQRQPPPYRASSESLDQSPQTPRLALPVAIPQRRPKDKKRGFIRAYAPDLQNVGISQETWFDFIETLNEASLANPWINAINLAAIAASPLPFLASTAISMALMVATEIAIETQGRYRQNKALDRLNDEFFRPRGLFCLVMKWDTESFSARTNASVDSTIQNALDTRGKKSHKFQSSNGVTNGMENMQVAELIFPGLDFLATATKDEQKGLKNKMSRGKLFIDDYLDRRAQAKFYAENPDSHLNQAGKPKFSSKYADPTHGVHNTFSAARRQPQSQNDNTDSGYGRQGLGRGRGGFGDNAFSNGPLGLVAYAGKSLYDRHQRRKADLGLGGASNARGSTSFNDDERVEPNTSSSRQGLEREGSQQRTSGQQPLQQPYTQQQYPQQGYPQQSYPQQGYIQQQYPNQQYAQQSYTQQPHPHEGSSQNPYPQQPYYQQGYPQQQYTHPYPAQSPPHEQYAEQPPNTSQQGQQSPERLSSQQQYQQRTSSGGVGGLNLSKAFGSRVLYLMVVNMPTEEEMAEAKRLTADWNIQGEEQQL